MEATLQTVTSVLQMAPSDIHGTLEKAARRLRQSRWEKVEAVHDFGRCGRHERPTMHHRDALTAVDVPMFTRIQC